MVSFSAFRTLDPEAIDLARDLLANAARQDSSFMSFMNNWMAFNGWMECVTDARSDRRMVEMIAEDRRSIEAYEQLLDAHAGFRQRIDSFADLWPVVNVRDARRKLGRDVFWRLGHDEFLDACGREGVQMTPEGWTGRGQPTWAQILRTVYAIRCNLFHGSKSPRNLRDRELVDHADYVISTFIEASGCFDWHD